MFVGPSCWSPGPDWPCGTFIELRFGQDDSGPGLRVQVQVQVRPEPSVQVRGSHWQAECPDKALLVCAKMTLWSAGQVVDLTVPAFTGRGGPQPPPPAPPLPPLAWSASARRSRAPAAARGIEGRQTRTDERTEPRRWSAAHCHGCRAPEAVRQKPCAGSRAPEAVRRKSCAGSVRRKPCAGSRAPEAVRQKPRLEAVRRQQCAGRRAPEGVRWKACAGSRASEGDWASIDWSFSITRAVKSDKLDRLLLTQIFKMLKFAHWD